LNQLRGDNLTIRLRNGTHIRLMLAKSSPKSMKELEDVHDAVLSAKCAPTKESKCPFISVH